MFRDNEPSPIKLNKKVSYENPEKNRIHDRLDTIYFDNNSKDMKLDQPNKNIKKQHLERKTSSTYNSFQNARPPTHKNQAIIQLTSQSPTHRNSPKSGVSENGQAIHQPNEILKKRYKQFDRGQTNFSNPIQFKVEKTDPDFDKLFDETDTGKFSILKDIDKWEFKNVTTSETNNNDGQKTLTEKQKNNTDRSGKIQSFLTNYRKSNQAKKSHEGGTNMYERDKNLEDQRLSVEMLNCCYGTKMRSHIRHGLGCYLQPLSSELNQNDNMTNLQSNTEKEKEDLKDAFTKTKLKQNFVKNNDQKIAELNTGILDELFFQKAWGNFIESDLNQMKRKGTVLSNDEIEDCIENNGATLKEAKSYLNYEIQPNFKILNSKFPNKFIHNKEKLNERFKEEFSKTKTLINTYISKNSSTENQIKSVYEDYKVIEKKFTNDVIEAKQTCHTIHRLCEELVQIDTDLTNFERSKRATKTSKMILPADMDKIENQNFDALHRIKDAMNFVAVLGKDKTVVGRDRRKSSFEIYSQSSRDQTYMTNRDDCVSSNQQKSIFAKSKLESQSKVNYRMDIDKEEQCTPKNTSQPNLINTIDKKHRSFLMQNIEASRKKSTDSNMPGFKIETHENEATRTFRYQHYNTNRRITEQIKSKADYTNRKVELEDVGKDNAFLKEYMAVKRQDILEMCYEVMKRDKEYLKKNGIQKLFLLVHGFDCKFDKTRMMDDIDEPGMDFLHQFSQLELEEAKTKRKWKEYDESKLIRYRAANQQHQQGNKQTKNPLLNVRSHRTSDIMREKMPLMGDAYSEANRRIQTLFGNKTSCEEKNLISESDPSELKSDNKNFQAMKESRKNIGNFSTRTKFLETLINIEAKKVFLFCY